MKRGAGENKYLYNGKELNSDFGLNWHYYGYRVYDAAIGRFPSVDPIADRFAFVSPFNYAENSPIANIDLWGLQAVSVSADVRVSAFLTGSYSSGILFDFKGNVAAFSSPSIGGGYIGGFSFGGGLSVYPTAETIYDLKGWGMSVIASGIFITGPDVSLDAALDIENDDYSLGFSGGMGIGLEAGAALEASYTFIYDNSDIKDLWNSGYFGNEAEKEDILEGLKSLRSNVEFQINKLEVSKENLECSINECNIDNVTSEIELIQNKINENSDLLNSVITIQESIENQ